jgi:hypothetical protein
VSANLEIKRIDLWSLFKLSFIIYAVIGVLVGLIYMVFFMLLGSMNSSFFADEFPNVGVLGGGVIGLLIIPFFAFINGIFGSVFTTIGGGVYNLIAGMAGGLKIDAREIVEARTASYTPPYASARGAHPNNPPQTSGTTGTGGPGAGSGSGSSYDI